MNLEPEFSDDRKIVVCAENRMRYQANNPRRISVRLYRPERDDRRQTAGKQAKACDFLLTTEGEAYFIELKGAHVKEALQQLLTTCERFVADLAPRKFKARVICAKTPNPNLIGAEQKALLFFLKKLNGGFSKEDLITKVSSLEENIS